MSKSVDLSLLSEREREIVDLAIDGLTDQQIGNKLSITASTVNSYWVRIRGKLGHLSRTELVSKAVHQMAAAERDSLKNLVKDLEGQIAQLRSTGLNSRLGNLFRAFIETIPEALVLFDANLRVIVCNEHFAQLFDLSPATVNGRQFSELFSVHNMSSDLSLEGIGDGAHLGLDFPLLGNRMDGSEFRALLHVGKGEFEDREIYSCIVRNLGVEVVAPPKFLIAG